MIVFDIDGTLADCSHRIGMVNGVGREREEQWRRFFDAAVLDAPIEPVIRIAETMVRAGRPVQLWSGRPERLRSLTLSWLALYAPELTTVPIRLRPDNDRRPDAELKEQWLQEWRGLGNEVRFVFEDRRRVVEMWRRNGVLCAAVAEGDY